MASIGNVIKQFDGSDELAQTQREVVESLSKLGESKADFFDLTIRESLRTAGQGSNQTVPITSILASTRQVRAYSSKDAEHIGEEVMTALKGFIQGSPEGVLNGVGTLISSALTVFLGKASASTGSISDYYVMTAGLSVLRVDLMAWYLNVTAQSIYSKMERVSAFVAVKSVVNLAKLDFSTFLFLYQQQLFAGGLPDSEVKKALDVAKEIYKSFIDIDKLGSPGGEKSAIAVHPGGTSTQLAGLLSGGKSLAEAPPVGFAV